ncbi:MAG: hypothetical protein KDA42_00365 [Planctomycetales bacterium]|nr:hypothetical protein [Planctomycetales bacterium]
MVRPAGLTLQWTNASAGVKIEVDETGLAGDTQPGDMADEQSVAPSTEESAVSQEQGAAAIPEAFRVAQRIEPPVDAEATEPEPASPDANANEVETDPALPEPEPVAVELSAEMKVVRDKVRQALDIYYHRRLNTRDHGPWEIMHSVVSFGVDAMVEQDGPGGEPITAIGWLCFNKPARGLTLFTSHRDSFVTRQGPGMQGHEGQLLAILAQARLREDYPLQIGGREFAVSDLIEYEKKTCRPHAEHTFKLIGLAHYLEGDAQWQNDLGQTWSIERLVHEEIQQPIRGAACGGSHRLFGLAYAVQRREKQGLEVDGVFLKTKKYIEDYQRYTFSLQNRDGSFSTRWFEGRGDSGDIDRKMKTTGHMLEFMLYTLPDQAVEDVRITRAATFLADLLNQHRSRRWENGPLGHAVHALALYSRRRFNEQAVPTPAIEGANFASDAQRGVQRQ